MKTPFLLLVFISAPIIALSQNVSGTEAECQHYITVQGFGINSLGNFKEDWESGAGAYIGYGVTYPNHWGVAFQTGYITYHENPGTDLGADPSFRIIPLMVGGRYYILLDRIRPFLTAMTGFNLVSGKYSAGGEVIDDFLVKLNFQIGVGFQIGVVSNLAIEVAGKYNSHLLNPNIPYNATGLEYGVALNWTLNR